MTDSKLRSKSLFRISPLFFFCTLLIVLVLLNSKKGIRIDTSMQSILPKSTSSQLKQSIQDRLFTGNQHKLVYILESKNHEQLLAATKTLQALIHSASIFKKTNETLELSDSDALTEQLIAHRHNFLSEPTRRQITAGQIENITTEAYRTFYDFSEGGGILSPSEDPLQLFNKWFTENYTPPQNFSLEDGLLVSAQASLSSSLSIAHLEGENLNTKTLSDLSQFTRHVALTLPREVNIYRSGMAFHAAEAVTQSKQDITFVSIGSTLGIILLFLFTFRKISPLIISLSSILFGCLSASIITHGYFSNLHIFTLVFGASLIGVTIDYSLHFFSKYHLPLHKEASITVSQKIFPSVTSGMLTSVIGFGCLFFSSMPTLKQIALFSISGLFSAWLFVVCAYPLIDLIVKKPLNRKKQKDSLLQHSAAQLAELISKTNKQGYLTTAVALCILCTSILIFQLETSTNIRSLNSSSKTLIASEKAARARLPEFSANQYYIVQGESEQKTLENEEAFRKKLDSAISSGAIRDYRAISRFIPSIKRQEHNQTVLTETFYGKSKQIKIFMTDLGFTPTYIDQHTREFQQSENTFLSFNTWLNEAPSALSFLWLGFIEEHYISIITLQNIQNLEHLQKLADEHSHISFVDTVSEISQGFAAQMSQASQLLVLAYIGISLLITLLHKTPRSLVLIFIPFASTVFTLSVLCLFGIDINIFHIFGLYLILGLGMDYGIFIRGTQTNLKYCYIAVILSALTSSLSFGFLSISQIPMMHSFGSVVLLGSLFNLVLSPLATHSKNKQAIHAKGHS